MKQNKVISIDPETLDKGKKQAKKKTRGNFSAYVQLLIEADYNGK